MCTVKKALTDTIATKLPKVAPMPVKKVAPIVKKTADKKVKIIEDEAPVVKVAKNNKARSALRIPTSNLTYG